MLVMPDKSCHTLFIESFHIYFIQIHHGLLGTSPWHRKEQSCSSMLDHSEAFVTGVIHLSCTPMRNSEPGIVFLRKHPSTSSTCWKEIWRGIQREVLLYQFCWKYWQLYVSMLLVSILILCFQGPRTGPWEQLLDWGCWAELTTKKKRPRLHSIRGAVAMFDHNSKGCCAPPQFSRGCCSTPVSQGPAPVSTKRAPVN